MVKQKKYYWLKLQKDFFKRHDVRIIESMDNGESYILFYLKLLVESIDHEGQLRFSETIPYNEKMLSTITNTNIDIVRSAVKIFTELGLMETLTDETIYMSEISKMIGAESVWAKKKRLYREEQNLLIEENNGFSHEKEVNNDKSEDIVLDESSKCPNNVRTFSDKSKSKSKSKSIELDKDYKEKNTKKENSFSSQTFNKFTGKNFSPETTGQKSLSQMITSAIDHWNNSGLPNCVYTVLTLPSSDKTELIKKFDVFRNGEILNAITNLSKFYDKINPTFRPKVFQRFILNSLDVWLDSAEPWKQFESDNESINDSDEGMEF